MSKQGETLMEEVEFTNLAVKALKTYRGAYDTVLNATGQADKATAIALLTVAGDTRWLDQYISVFSDGISSGHLSKIGGVA